MRVLSAELLAAPRGGRGMGPKDTRTESIEGTIVREFEIEMV